MPAENDDVVRNLAEATAALLDNLSRLTEAQARGPSLLPGWSRGHVLSHLARNAEGGTRLLRWARTGVPSYEYRSVAARAADIDAGAGRPAELLLADVTATAAAFAESAAVMPEEAWSATVTWTTGQQSPATEVPRSRLGEVLIHRVDLDLGYRPADWPTWFTERMLPAAARRLSELGLAELPGELTASDTGRSFFIGGQDPRPVSGTEADLLAWLLGRSDGAALTKDQPGPLPPVPSLYFT